MQKKFADAIAYAGKALELDPNNLQSFYVRGIAYSNIAERCERDRRSE